MTVGVEGLDAALDAEPAGPVVSALDAVNFEHGSPWLAPGTLRDSMSRSGVDRDTTCIC